VIPVIRDSFRDGRFPKELIPEMGRLGFFGANLEGYGCAGMSNVEYGLVMQELECEVEYREALYLAEAAKILAAIRGAPAAVPSLMMVGHNPGLEALATLLAREPVRRKERARHEALEEKFPTCALAILDFDVGRWRDVAPGTGKLVDFVRPKDL